MVVTPAGAGDIGDLPEGQEPPPIKGRPAPHDVVYRGMAVLDDAVVAADGRERWDEARTRHAERGAGAQ
jgi:hypothetical protein